MKRYIKNLFLVLLFTLSPHIISANLSLILRRAQSLSAKQLEKLPRIICSKLTKKELPQEIILEATSFLREHETPYPLINLHTEIIYCACTLFLATPGFRKTLCKLFTLAHDDGNTRGTVYEIECALNLATQGHTIKAFNPYKKIPRGTKQQEFDIETSNKWIECKNINWELAAQYEKKRKKLCKQFLRQKRCVEHHNRLNGLKPVAYEVHTCQPITQDWQVWFEEHNISFCYDGEN